MFPHPTADVGAIAGANTVITLSAANSERGLIVLVVYPVALPIFWITVCTPYTETADSANSQVEADNLDIVTRSALLAQENQHLKERLETQTQQMLHMQVEVHSLGACIDATLLCACPDLALHECMFCQGIYPSSFRQGLQTGSICNALLSDVLHGGQYQQRFNTMHCKYVLVHLLKPFDRYYESCMPAGAAQDNCH